ncbi:MAG: radical SAM family heme chaperone HemW [Clostridia bacterium]
MKKIGLYIHIPFCVQKCHYCDFNSYAGISYMKDQYTHAMIEEMKLYKEKNSDIEVGTIFIGGGTPTCLEAPLLEDILISCRELFELTEDCEISIESNPGTLTKEKLRMLKQNGVNRLSIGLQCWDDLQLKRLGRIHSKDQFVENYHSAREEGFDNINIDLMFSLPDQTLQQWERTLHQVIQLMPEHISCYALKIEEGTRFYQDYQNKKLQMPDEDVDRDMYEAAIKMLISNDYSHYEISNFAKRGYECKHNLLYWKSKEYQGIGAGAHSYINAIRYANIKSPEEYIKRIKGNLLPVEEEEQLAVKDQMSEFMFLGLRLIGGVNSSEFYQRFGVELDDIYEEELNKLIALSLIEAHKYGYKLTRRGIDLSNQVFMEFI